MRSAAILGALPGHVIRYIGEKWLDPQRRETLVRGLGCKGNTIFGFDMNPDVWSPSLGVRSTGFALNITRNLPAHTDDVAFPYTFGIILEGGHTLFTGRGNPVGHLHAGSVYWLNNTRLHGVKALHGDGPALVFGAADFQADDDRHALDIAQRVFARLSESFPCA
jgi:hypothetical protein